MSQGLAGVRKAARKDKKVRFTALLHHLTVDQLRESFYGLKRKAAPGVDGVTWQGYEPGLQESLLDLHSRVHRGTYRAKPSRRVYIEKGRRTATSIGDRGAGGQDRPAGRGHHPQPDIRGRLSRFLVWLPSRAQPASSAGCAVVCAAIKKVNYVLDADIRGFFDNLDKSWLAKFVEHRVADPRILRLIQKWLSAGVLEEGIWSETTLGTPQGSVASPMLANIYLHYVFDLWMDKWRKQCAQGA